MIAGQIVRLTGEHPLGLPLDAWVDESAMWLDLVQLAEVFGTDPFTLDDWVFHRGWIPRMKQHRVWVPAEAAVEYARVLGACDLVEWLTSRAEEVAA